MSITEDQFRKTLGLFSTGVAIATTPHGHEDVSLTISSLTSVSLKPPQILFCLSKHSKRAPVFVTCSFFAINILTEHQAYISDSFARHTSPEKAIEICRHKETGCLLIADALGHIICERAAIYEGGDHHIILGRVVALGANSSELPLVRQRGRYLTTQVIDSACTKRTLGASSRNLEKLTNAMS